MDPNLLEVLRDDTADNLSTVFCSYTTFRKTYTHIYIYIYMYSTHNRIGGYTLPPTDGSPGAARSLEEGYQGEK